MRGLWNAILVGVLFSFGSVVVAQNEPAITTGDPGIPLDELELRLKPLTRAQLKVEADGWMQLLQNTVSEVTTTEIASRIKKAGLSVADELKSMLQGVEDARQALAMSPDDEETQKNLSKAKQAFEQKFTEVRDQVAKAQQDKEVTKAVRAAAAEAEKLAKENADQEDMEADTNTAVPIEPEQNKELAALNQEIAEVEADEAESRTQLLNALTALREQQTAMIDRVNRVIDAYEEKGGAVEEIEEYRQYITAVSGIKVELTDAEAVWTTLTGWMLSSEGGLRLAKNVAFFVITILVFMVISKIAGKALQKVLASSKQASKLLSGFMVTSVRRLIMAIGIIVGLAAMEVDVGPLLAVIGAAGFVIAFALQNSLGNFASGILILTFRPFDEGDIIEVAGVLGKVQSMNLLSVQIHTPDNKQVIIANNQIWGSVITNVTGTNTRRIDLVFGIAYEDDIDHAQRLMHEVVDSHELVLKRPEPVIRVHELGDSSVNFVCRPWVKGKDYWAVYWDLTEQIKKRFDKEGVSIPYPQRDVHLIQATAETTA